MTTLKHFFLTSALVLGAAANAQQLDVHRPQAKIDPLAAACDGAWAEIEAANRSLRLLPQTALTETNRARLVCLLQTIGQMTFDPRDAQFNSYMQSTAAQLVVGAYGPAGHDFFAEQLVSNEVGSPVRRGLHGVLLAAGHPEAFQVYFAERREKLARGEQCKPENAAAPSLFEPLLTRGACREGVCNHRIAETLKIIAANLDLLDLEMQAAESFSAVSNTDDARELARQRREDARSLRDTINHIRRGDAKIGAVSR